MYRASAKLVCHITQRYGIPIDRTHIIGHYQVPTSTHHDPGPLLELVALHGPGAPGLWQGRLLRRQHRRRQHGGGSGGSSGGGSGGERQRRLPTAAPV